MNIYYYLGTSSRANPKREIHIKMYINGSAQRCGTRLYLDERFFEWCINRETCRRIGIHVPRSLYAVSSVEAYKHHYVLLDYGHVVLHSAATRQERDEVLEIIASLDSLKGIIFSEYSRALLNRSELGKGWLKTLVMTTLNPGITSSAHPGFQEASDIYGMIEKYISLVRMSPDHIRCFRLLEHLLFRFEIYTRFLDKTFSLQINSIDSTVIEQFRSYLTNEHELVVRYPKLFMNIFDEQRIKFKNACHADRAERISIRSNNYVVVLLCRLRTFMLWMLKSGYISSNPFISVKVGTEHYGTPYYLTTEERDTIADFDLSATKELAIQRDIFIFQCLVGCRVGDLIRFRRENVVDDFLQYYPNKTKDAFVNQRLVRVPLNARAQAILRKYQDRDDGSLLPFVSPQYYNRALKKIFTICNIRREVVILDPKTELERKVCLNEVASSHLARRTFIGNLYKKVKDPNLICPMSGHSYGSKAFSRYHSVDNDMMREIINLL